MRKGIRLVLSLGRPDPDALSTATLWSLIAHLALLTGAIVVRALPSATVAAGPAHFVSLAAPAPIGAGGGTAEPEPPKPAAAPPAPKHEVEEPPAPPVKAPTKASIPTDRQPKPTPPARAHGAPAQDDAHAEGTAREAGAGAPGAPGAPGGVGETGGVGGASFGEGDFRYGWYTTAIESKLQTAWRRPMATEPETQTVTVSFTILRNGSVKDVAVGTASGNSSLDLSAMRAVYDANPLPALPRGWSGDSVHVSMEFVLRPSE